MVEISPDVTIAQNIYFSKIYSNFTTIITKIMASGKNMTVNKEKLMRILLLGEKLNIDTEFYKNIIVKASSKITV